MTGVQAIALFDRRESRGLETGPPVGYRGPMQSVLLPISLTAEQWLPFYRGMVKSVHATALDGRRIQLPAQVLQPFVTKDGIVGLFRVRFDQQNRFVDIELLRGPKSMVGRKA